MGSAPSLRVAQGIIVARRMSMERDGVYNPVSPGLSCYVLRCLATNLPILFRASSISDSEVA